MSATSSTSSTSSTTTTSSASSTATSSDGEHLFKPIDADETSGEVTEMESLCMNCEEQGVTRLLLTKVPFFREIILMAFSCEHCGYESTEVQYGGEIQPKGVRYTLNATSPRDCNRQVVKSDLASILIPHIEFEIPASTQKGSLNTVEGFLTNASVALNHDQPLRRIENPEVAEKIDAVIHELEECAQGAHPFSFVLDDPAGNSFIQNPSAPAEDPQLLVEHYTRSEDQDRALCINVASKKSAAELVPEHKNASSTIKGLGLPGNPEAVDVTPEEVAVMEQHCAMCGAVGELRAILAKIPFFKEVTIMAYTCNECGYRTNEVKCGGAISPKGRKLTLQVRGKADLDRSFLKSDTASLRIPEVDLELGEGSLGGKFTTVEGILTDILTQLENLPFVGGDSAEAPTRARMQSLLASMKEFRDGTAPFTLIVDDPLANSHIQRLDVDDSEPSSSSSSSTTEPTSATPSTTVVSRDSNFEVIDYERSMDQNDRLGLLDMNTENYTNNPATDTASHQPDTAATTVSASATTQQSTTASSTTTTPGQHHE
ncbi:nucleolar zincfinger protein [Pelomyxa schiedti]|nr:nucleolar zincfinger protein [Pelomyxa schiedti]